MIKKIFAFSLLLTLLCSPVFAGVAVEEDGTYIGEATTIDFDNLIAGSFDGSTYVVPVSKVSALTHIADLNITATAGTVFTLTPTADTNLHAFSGKEGQPLSVVITSRGHDYSVTFSTNFRSTGRLALGSNSRVYSVSFVNDGTDFIETGRTGAQQAAGCLWCL